MEDNTQPKIKCPNCGTYNWKFQEKCDDCGAKISLEDNLASQGSATPPPKNYKTALYVTLAISIISIWVFASVAYSIGSASGTANERRNIASGLDSELADKKAYESNLTEYIVHKDSYDAELASEQATLSAISAQADALKKSLTPNGSPLKLPAGVFTVGKDIPAGRYSATGSSNFAVYTASGSLKVNTILSANPDDQVEVSSYVCSLDDGDVIKAEGSDTFTPVN